MRPLLLWTRQEAPDPQQLEAAGIDHFWLPLVHTQSMRLTAELKLQLEQAAAADALVFVSRAGVQAALALSPSLADSTAQLFAVGPATADAVQAGFARPAQSPALGADSEALWPLLLKAKPTRVALLSAPMGREWLERQLTGAAIAHQVVHVYRRVAGQIGAIERAAVASELHRIIFMATSVALVDSLAALLADLESSAWSRPLLCASKRIAEHASKLGFTQTKLAQGADPTSILAALSAMERRAMERSHPAA